MTLQRFARLLLVCVALGCGGGLEGCSKSTGRGQTSTTPVGLRIVSQPQATDVNQPLAAISVEIIGSSGQRVTTYAGEVKVRLQASGLGRLAGVTSATASGGLATFSGLSVDRAGQTNTLTFSSSSLADAQSAPFVVRSKATVPAFGCLILPSAWDALTSEEVRLHGVAFTHQSASSLGGGISGQVRVEYSIARGPGSNWFWPALAAHGAYVRVLENDGRYRLDYTDPTTRQTLLAYLKAEQAEAVFFDSVDKPASWGGVTPGLDTMIDEILAAGLGQRVYMSAGGFQGSIGLDPTHAWRRDPRIVVLDEGLDAADYVRLGKQSVGPYVLGADFTRFGSVEAALEHEVACVAAVLVLQAEFGVEAWLSTTTSPDLRTFQGTPEIQSFDFGDAAGTPTLTQDFEGIHASSPLTFHRRPRAVVVHNTSGSAATLTVPSSLQEFAIGGQFTTPRAQITVPAGGCWLWVP